MTGPALQTCLRLAAGYVPPPGREPWRADLALASGLTAMAVEAALRDVALRRFAPQGRVLRDPLELDRTVIDPAEGRVLVCSFSGRSSEALDGLARLRFRGIRCDLHGAGPGADLPIPPDAAERPVLHAAFCATVPTLVGTPLAPSAVTAPTVGPFLADAAASGLVPLFVSDRDGFLSRALLSHWLEYIQQPGFRLVYPDFTHDFLWAGARSRLAGYAFVLERPAEDLSDGRFAQLCGLLREACVPHLVLEAGRPRSPGDHIGLLLAIADEMLALALSLGRDLQTELTFDSWEKECRT